jgi:transcriptional regulator with XRE-family HTH domain
MPELDTAEERYRRSLASLLALFRTASGETHQELEERFDLPQGKWGRWERGQYPPKAHELTIVHRAFRAYGLRAEWLLDPPDLNSLKAIRERLIAAALAGTIAADEAEARAMARRLRAGERLAGVRGRRSA